MTEHLRKNAKEHKRRVKRSARSGESRFSRTEIWKYVCVFLIFIFIVWLTVFQSGSTKPFEEVAQAVQSSIQDEDLVQQDSQAVKKYYGLNSAEYEGVLFYTAESAMSAKEVLMIKVKHDYQVEAVTSAIEKRLETRMNSFEGYAPEQMQLLEAAEYTVRGNFIFLAIAPEAAVYRQAFARSL